MSVPPFDRVRKLLADILALLQSWAAPGAIIEELRFMQRRFFGVDSAGTIEANNVRDLLEGALYMTIVDEFGDVARFPLAQMFHAELVAPTELRTKSWLQEIRTVLRRIETHYLPDSDDAATAGKLKEIRDAVAGLRATSGFPGESDAGLGDLWVRLNQVEAALVSLAGTVTALTTPVTAIAEDVACLQAELAPDCGFVDPFPAPPAECNEFYTNLEYIITLTDTTDAHVGPGAFIYTLQPTNVGALTVLTGSGGNELLALANEESGPRTFGYIIQRATGFAGVPTGVFNPFIPADMSPAGRPSADLLSVDACDTFTLYAEEAAEPNRRIGYLLGFGIGPGQETGPQDVRILIYSGAFG